VVGVLPATGTDHTPAIALAAAATVAGLVARRAARR
jgi:LPXTG-motif cell wall-anchored protein